MGSMGVQFQGSAAERYKNDVRQAKEQIEAVSASRPTLLDGDGVFLAEVTDSGDLRVNDLFMNPANALAVAQFIFDNFQGAQP
jgi:hypothetical protein